MLQSSWRCRKSRQKANKLKEEKYLLLCEKSALRLQSAWRIKQSKMIFFGKVTAKKQYLAKRYAAVEKLKHMMLMFMAKLKYRMMLRKLPHVWIGEFVAVFACILGFL